MHYFWCKSSANRALYHPRSQAKISGTTVDASGSMMNLGVVSRSLPQVSFSLGAFHEMALVSYSKPQANAGGYAFLASSSALTLAITGKASAT